MKPIKDFDKIETNEYEEFPPVGGYVAIIKNVRDVEDKSYLELLVDIADGEYSGFYQRRYENTGKWSLRAFASYNSAYEFAIKKFKTFITSVEKSNPNYSWEWKENTLKGKRVGIIVREEEYLKDDGTVGVSNKVCAFRSADTIRKGDFKVPPRKELANKPQPKPKTNINFSALDDIQF